MFTFSDELVFGTPTTCENGPQIHNDLTMDHAYMDSNLLSFASSDGDGRLHGETTSFEPPLQRKTKSKNECSVRKLVMHREVEKQRRKEMSSLCASLGSLLPLGQIKGKRSVCDLIQEAVDHIKQTEKNIEGLRIRRDKMKKSLALANPKISSSPSTAADDCITVNLASEGVDILISTSDLRLSRLHAVLAQRDLDVVSCVSTSTMGRLFHIIKIEAPNMTSFDASELQDQLNDAIKY